MAYINKLTIFYGGLKSPLFFYDFVAFFVAFVIILQKPKEQQTQVDRLFCGLSYTIEWE